MEAIGEVGRLRGEQKENFSCGKPLDWLAAGGTHVDMADVTSHVGPICLPTSWELVSVSKAELMRHA